MNAPRHGIGLRAPHFTELLADGLYVGLVEVITENLVGRGGRPLAVVERVRRDSPLALHGVSLSIGGLDPLREDFVRAVAALAKQLEAELVSDHLCFGSFGGHRGHDLWPFPFTEEALRHVVPRIERVQELLGRRLVLENVSSYVQFVSSELTEWAFLREVAERADCELLLDLNNVFVNATNHGFDALAFIEGLPTSRIRQLHLAGHADHGTHLFDDHGAPVAEPVWELFAACVRQHGPIPTIVEWDDRIPPLARLLAESERAQRVEAAALTKEVA